MQPLDPKHAKAIQDFKAALAALTAAGIPVNQTITDFATAANAQLVALYEKLLGIAPAK